MGTALRIVGLLLSAPLRLGSLGSAGRALHQQPVPVQDNRSEPARVANVDRN